MISLGGKILETNYNDLKSNRIFKISRNKNRPEVLKKNELYILDSPENIPAGFFGYVGFKEKKIPDELLNNRWFKIEDTLNYLNDGDIVRINKGSSKIRVLYRESSKYNAFLLTERCNHYCLMCSQPPKKVNDEWLVEEVGQALRLMNRSSGEIGFTGGEPTLLEDSLVNLIRLAKSHVPEKSLHILSNGTNFSDGDLANKIGAVHHPDLMFGIPIYSDASEIHDYIVQSDGSFDKTIRGLLNLNRAGVSVEIRVVLQKENIARLPELANFISRSLPFASHVAFMGLEMMGFARANIEKVWAEPIDYSSNLEKALLALEKHGIRASTYNLQLCLLPQSIWRFSRQSISDWKNDYQNICHECSARYDCAGFFSSAVRKLPSGITPFNDPDLFMELKQKYLS